MDAPLNEAATVIPFLAVADGGDNKFGVPPAARDNAIERRAHRGMIEIGARDADGHRQVIGTDEQAIDARGRRDRVDVALLRVGNFATFSRTIPP